MPTPCRRGRLGPVAARAGPFPTHSRSQEYRYCGARDKYHSTSDRCETALKPFTLMRDRQLPSPFPSAPSAFSAASRPLRLVRGPAVLTSALAAAEWPAHAGCGCPLSHLHLTASLARSTHSCVSLCPRRGLLSSQRQSIAISTIGDFGNSSTSMPCTPSGCSRARRKRQLVRAL